ncbi:uncharacterized protein LOC134188627 [Corticium candelabrum]|uniref:uncharacterized protein LOC134188627 n=1 Tax=Corticium candelabrum TaxID=121492 RepID=UPI002E2740C6|nr:uncharacterized protein LOC134188627 [Corticium candelabrum]
MIVVGMRFSLLIDDVLHIQNVTEQDSGHYECTATVTFSLFGGVQNRIVPWSVTVYRIYQCIARNEYGSKQSSLYATVSGVVPTVSATSRSPTTAPTLPSMPQSTDYVTTLQSTPRASSTSTSSSYSSQPTNATSHNVQSTSGTKSPRVTSAPVTVTQAKLSDTVSFKVATAVVAAVVFILFLVIVALLIYIQRKHQRDNSQDAMVMNGAYNVVSDKPRDNAEQMEDANYVEVRASSFLNNTMHN